MTYFNLYINYPKSIRLKGYDYAQSGLYFITNCCVNRACLFGDIVDGQMTVKDYGHAAFYEWVKTPEMRRNVKLDEFIVIQNHYRLYYKQSIQMDRR